MGQETIPPTPSSASLAGKTVVITGANSGIGLEAVRQCLQLKASKVIIAVRTPSKGDQAVELLQKNPAIKDLTPKPELKVMKLDLDDFESVISFANAIKKEEKSLDVLLLNGGVNIMSWQMSASGHERVMQVNYLSNALLALELLPLLRQTAASSGTPTRLSFVGSEAQGMNSMAKKPITADEPVLKHFDDQTKYSSFGRYGDSKMLVSMFVQELAKRVPAQDVVINNMCPGLVATGFDVNLPIWLKAFMFVLRKVQARSLEGGTRTLIHAIAVAGSDTHGAFIANNHVKDLAPFVQTPEGKRVQEKLWTETLEECVKVDSSLSGIVQ